MENQKAISDIIAMHLPDAGLILIQKKSDGIADGIKVIMTNGTTLEIGDYAKDITSLLIPDQHATHLQKMSALFSSPIGTTIAREETVIDMKSVVEPFRLAKERSGRNEQCRCGSGKKYKNCCIHKNK